MDAKTRIVSANWMAGPAAIVAVVLSGIVYSSEKLWDHIWEDLDQAHVFLFTIPLFALLLWGCAYLFAPRVNRITQATARVRTDAELTPPEYLITGYSPIGNLSGFDATVKAQALVEDFEGNLGNVCDEHKLDRNLYPLSWQQNLRVIRAACRKGKLKQVLVVEPNFDQFEAFQTCISGFCPEIDVKRVSAKGNPSARFTTMYGSVEGQDYENFDYVTAAIARAFEMIAEDAGKKIEDLEDRVAFDVTPGLKIFSIATAIQSLNRNAIFYYAKTNGPDQGKVIAYDASIGFSTSPM
ncbi:hypothetical protein [Donghicola mangrovi]|uniref:Uncharacterized protein n=1 Tax=Donghicola mangrovi TaxID=2729614 RepID=A0A850Q162_9RHOB|nr:hypothetical protein [Donghicola mangrovi]NVO23317.1 hypothetical protein [Donghicola mangrovi]